MSHPTPSLDQAQLRETLIAFLDYTTPTCGQLDYRLVGTAATLLHGVTLPTADIDILVKDRSSVEAFGAALSAFECLFAPAWLEETQQYYGNYEMYGIEVGISTVEVASDADTIETFGRGPWEHFKRLPCGHYSVPTVALELRLITELYRDRPDRYKPIIQYLRGTGCDIDLIQRGLQAAWLPENVQESVLDQLKVSPLR